MTDKLELKSSHEVVYTVYLADVDSIFQGKPTDPDILTVVMKGGRRLYCDEVCPVDSLQEEPVSEELENAAFDYADACKYYGTEKLLCVEHFKAGAKWQKQQFEKNRLKHCNSITNEQAELEQGFIDQHLDKHQRMPTFLDAIEYGMEKMKQQMMKEPNLSGYVARDEDGNLHVFEVEPRRLEEKHRWWDRDYNCYIIDNDAFPDLRWEDEPICVKLIIIKED